MRAYVIDDEAALLSDISKIYPSAFIRALIVVNFHVWLAAVLFSLEREAATLAERTIVQRYLDPVILMYPFF